VQPGQAQQGVAPQLQLKLLVLPVQLLLRQAHCLQPPPHLLGRLLWLQGSLRGHLVPLLQPLEPPVPLLLVLV
jgi:hypothetical protein